MKLNRNESNDSKNVELSTQLIGTHSLYMYLAYAYTQYICSNRIYICRVFDYAVGSHATKNPPYVECKPKSLIVLTPKIDKTTNIGWNFFVMRCVKAQR